MTGYILLFHKVGPYGRVAKPGPWCASREQAEAHAREVLPSDPEIESASVHLFDAVNAKAGKVVSSVYRSSASPAPLSAAMAPALGALSVCGLSPPAGMGSAPSGALAAALD